MKRLLFSIICVLLCIMFVSCGKTQVLSSLSDTSVYKTDVASPIKIKFFSLKDVDSQGGVYIATRFDNVLSEDIKYITIKVFPYNSVGDGLLDDITFENYFIIKMTGPFRTGESFFETTEPIFYNKDTKTFKLGETTVEYMNGDIYKLTHKSELDNLF